MAEESRTALPPLDVSTFILSLGASAMVNLGMVPAPGETGAAKDLPAAKQIIDILSLLEEKTRGNLSGEEERLLHQVLFDLRMRFSRKAKG